jgi:NAD-dependent dihydropyrimidine dehydrogenase PreA subunit
MITHGGGIMMMEKSNGLKVIVSFLVIVFAVVFLSSLSARLWGGKSEKPADKAPIQITEAMTIEEFGKVNGLSKEVLKEVFGITVKEDLQKTIGATGIPKEEVLSRVTKEGALNEEFESKNWVLIPIKFVLWFGFLAMVFVYMRKSLITPKIRRIFYFVAVAVFGVILGSDPSPMGTVKDAVVLLGTKGVIFPPRMIALTIFLVTVFLANKFICSWGCQFGTLQDTIFRINRSQKDRTGMFFQIKLPFVVTNTIRITTFCALAIIAFAWSFDIIGAVDPFKIYKPSVVAVYGWVFIGAILVAGLFVYRPWCHLFCPFGLVGWIVEKISIFKIQVNYDTCIACEACAKACPSSVMEAILKRERKTIPDCFSCATCIGVCPTNSISLKSGKRAIPPEDKFQKNDG